MIKVLQRERRRLAMALVLLVVAMLAVGLGGVRKNTSLDAFVPADSPALALRDEVTARFGLTEPIAVAYIGAHPDAALDAAVLAEVRSVSELLQNEPGIDPDQVMSLSTRSWVAAEDNELNVRRILPDGPIDAGSAVAVRAGLQAATGWRGVLLSNDGSAAMILAEVRKGADPGLVYQSVEKRLRARTLPPGVQLSIAGQATISGYLSRYIDRDTRTLVPLAIALCLVLMTVMLRTWASFLIGLSILAGTLLATLGLMGWLGKPMYVITSTLPVVVLCASIADAIHLLARARQLREDGLDARMAIDQALSELIRPLTLTTITTVFGFLGLTVGSAIPAMREYGLFAAFGISVAWLMTVLVAPELYVLMSRRPPSPRSTNLRQGPVDLATGALARLTARSPGLVLAAGGVLLVLGLAGLSQLQFNYERVRNFGRHSEVFKSNAAINDRFSGTYNLDVLLTGQPGALLDPALLARVDGLQRWMVGEDGFSDTLSYVDLIRDTARAANPDLTQADALPGNADYAEQLLFLFEASANPGELSQRISSDRSHALIRGYLRTDNFQVVQPQVKALQVEVQRRFAGSGVQADITGPVYVTTSWVGPLLGNTMFGIAITIAMVGTCVILMFRSVRLGLLCVLPVSMAVLFVFGLMGAMGIWLDVVTSMFATICIGLGVDFAIHMLHALTEAQDEGLQGADLVLAVHARIGAPLAFNALALAGGMAVTLLSAIPPVGYFGALTALAVLSSYVATLLTLPPLYARFTSKGPARTSDADLTGVAP